MKVPVSSSNHDNQAHQATENQVPVFPVQVPDATSALQCRFSKPDPIFMESGPHPNRNFKFDLYDALVVDRFINIQCVAGCIEKCLCLSNIRDAENMDALDQDLRELQDHTSQRDQFRNQEYFKWLNFMCQNSSLHCMLCWFDLGMTKPSSARKGIQIMTRCQWPLNGLIVRFLAV
jgi:hypothetical protein